MTSFGRPSEENRGRSKLDRSSPRHALAHTDLTRRRIAAFISSELKPRIDSERVTVEEIEINESACESQAEAQKGPWKEVKNGYEYGPAYTVFWFRLTGRVPESFVGQPISVVAEVGGERTVWKDGFTLARG